MRSLHPLEVPFEKVPIQAYSEAGFPFIKWVSVGMPKLGQYSGLLKSVFFLYRSVADAKAGTKSGGTGFLVATQFENYPDRLHVYGVTNWHVAARGSSIIRLNKVGGGHDIFEYGPDQWEFIPGGPDIAVIPLHIRFDNYEITYLDTKNWFLDEATAAGFEIGPGEDVFMVGRFIDYDGVETNKPSLRFGHISMTNAPIRQPTGSTEESFVVDLHSRTGFSGSPVVVYRTIGSHFFDAEKTKGKVLVGGGHTIFLLGINWGQFPEMWELKEGEANPNTTNAPLITKGKYVEGLSGMSCVCPAWSILKVLEMPKLRNQRKAIEAMVARIKGPDLTPKPDSAVSDPPDSDANPKHLEDFNRLLDAAARKPKQDG